MFTSPTVSLPELRQTLFSVAYKMIGEVAPSEDIVQDVLTIYLNKKANNQLAEIVDMQKYLIKAATNHSINYLKKASKERAKYFGVWLPEPITQQSSQIDYKVDLDYGITFLLCRFNPKERAVFILKNAFDFSFKEIGSCLNIKEATCRKIFQRLHPKLQKPSEQINAEKAAKERLLGGFLAAGQEAGLDLLVQILKEDITIYSDGGGKVTSAKNPIIGAVNCAKFLLGLLQKRKGELQLSLGKVNGETALYMHNLAGELDTIALLTLTRFKIQAIYLIRNPDKLKVKSQKGDVG